MSKRKKPEKPAPRVDEDGNPICGAKLKRGKPGVCKRPPMANGRCYHHGGASPPPGPDHPRYKDGRRSKYLPDKIARRFDEAMADPELLSARENVALVRVRKQQLEERLNTEESSLTWKQLKKCWGEFKRGQRMQREATSIESEDLRNQMLAEARALITESLEAADKLISAGAAEQQQWDELRDINLEENSLKQSETVRLQRMQQMMTIAEVGILIHQVQQAISATFTDKEQLRKFGFALQHIIDHGCMPPPESPVVDMVPAIDAAPITAEEKRE